MPIGNILESERVRLGQKSQHVFRVPGSDHCVQNNQAFEHNLYLGEVGLDARGLGRGASRHTVALGSLNLGARARQTSETAPSSEYVAAIIGSRYCKGAALVRNCEDKWESTTHLRFGWCSFWLASQLDYLLKAHTLQYSQISIRPGGVEHNTDQQRLENTLVLKREVQRNRAFTFTDYSPFLYHLSRIVSATQKLKCKWRTQVIWIQTSTSRLVRQSIIVNYQRFRALQ